MTVNTAPKSIQHPNTASPSETFTRWQHKIRARVVKAVFHKRTQKSVICSNFFSPNEDAQKAKQI